MTDLELEILLTERVKTLDLKKAAFETLEKIFFNNAADKEFLRGFTSDEIIEKFDGFEYRIQRREAVSIIRTRIGLYVENQNWLDNLEPIGYYELETNLNGDVLDDWFVIEKEKYLKDIDIISCFQNMNEKLPIEYLRRNHLNYEFVSYISMVGTLFLSKQFEGAGRFAMRAYSNLKTIDYTKFNPDYRERATEFLSIISSCLVKNSLVSDSLKQQLIGDKSVD